MSRLRPVPAGCEIITTDVVVVGYGGAGAVAALTAREAGASVVVLEKATHGGGSTAEAGGSIRDVRDVSGAIRHLETLADGATPIDVIEAYVRNLGPFVEWLRGLGADLVELNDPGLMRGWPRILSSPYPSVPGAEAMGGRLRVRAARDGEIGGESLWRVLHAAMTSAEIPVYYETPAERLIQDPRSGAIEAVLAARGGQPVLFEARRGVVLCTGGFSHNPQMLRDYLGLTLPAFGSPSGPTGEGVRMAADVGAALWHMSAIAVVFGYRIPGFASAFRHQMPDVGYIYVDQRATRYLDETGLDFHSIPMSAFSFDPAVAGYPRLPSYVIFDDRTRAAGPVTNLSFVHYKDAVWSADNSREVELGWIKRGSTAGELAAELGLPARSLEQTVEEYNAACRAGHDARFRRAPATLQALEPPYYGLPIWPALLNTQGGPRRDARCQVLDVYGEPIPRLFGAGELGSMWTTLYPGAGNLGEALVTGRLAGAQVAACPRR